MLFGDIYQNKGLLRFLIHLMKYFRNIFSKNKAKKPFSLKGCACYNKMNKEYPEGSKYDKTEVLLYGISCYLLVAADNSLSQNCSLICKLKLKFIYIF